MKPSVITLAISNYEFSLHHLTAKINGFENSSFCQKKSPTIHSTLFSDIARNYRKSLRNSFTVFRFKKKSIEVDFTFFSKLFVMGV